MFTFKGIASNLKGVTVREVENSLLPPVNERTVNIPSRHGGLDYGRVYGMREISILIGVKAKTDTELRSTIREIARWLNSPKLEKLILSDEPDKVYMARIVGETSLSPLYKYEEATLVFQCPDPFPTSLAGKTSNLLTSVGATTSITVAGSFETFPIFTIKMTAIGKSFSITSDSDEGKQELRIVDNFIVGDTVVIDCELGKITVNGSSANILTLDTDFLTLYSGLNKFKYEGSGTVKVEYFDKWL